MLASALDLAVVARRSPNDLSPLVKLAELEVIHLGITPGTDLTPLLACQRLRRARLDGFEQAAHGQVSDALRANGVVVDAVSEGVTTPAPFLDPNLKLAVLQALAERGMVELPALIAIDEFELDRENLNRLLIIPLCPAQLEAVVELSWMGAGMKLQHAVFPQFDGEGKCFYVRSLRGIEALPNLRKLTLQYCTVEAELEADILNALQARGVEVVILLS